MNSARSGSASHRCGALSAVALLCSYSYASSASAAELAQSELYDAGTEEELPLPDLDKSARLESAPGFSFGLGAYAGFALQTTPDDNRSHAIVGALSRFRYSYFELGAVLELSDTSENRWRSVGGFAGAWLPYRNWVDLEFAVGGAARSYLSPEVRYGAGGYDFTIPAVIFRAGVSDRTSETLFGARLGCELVGSIDLGRKTVPWRYELQGEEGTRVFSGRSRLGGFSLGLVVSAAFDVGVKRQLGSRSSPMGSGLPALLF